MKRWMTIAVAVLTLALYAGVVVLGVRLGPQGLGWMGGAWLGSMFQSSAKSHTWHVEPMNGLSPEKLREIEYGSKLFNETPVYGSQYAKARIACAGCHVEGGIAPYSAPMVGATQAYPKFSERANRKITLDDRIEECMTRSENGLPVPNSSAEMQALKAYINWLSEPHRDQAKFAGWSRCRRSPLTRNMARRSMQPSAQAVMARTAKAHDGRIRRCGGRSRSTTERAWVLLRRCRRLCNTTCRRTARAR
jgi:hypothetical protein